jgi:hypothetical protein
MTHSCIRPRVATTATFAAIMASRVGTAMAALPDVATNRLNARGPWRYGCRISRFPDRLPAPIDEERHPYVAQGWPMGNC